MMNAERAAEMIVAGESALRQVSREALAIGERPRATDLR
jgi:hypothetical protein